MKKCLVLSVIICCLFAASASASPMQMFTAPASTFQNTANNPCVFFGPGLSGCAQDPAGWLAPAGPTNQGPVGPLTQVYAGADYTEFKNVIGSEFIIGYDINDTSTSQTLTDLTFTFRDAMNNIVSQFTATPTLVPDEANGVGYADYIFAKDCAQVSCGVGGGLFDAFLTPGNATSVTFTFAMNPANDGPDKIFLIGSGAGNQCLDCTPTPFSTVPEPASMTLLGSGLLGVVRLVRKKRQ